jgi:hypothetical protein
LNILAPSVPPSLRITQMMWGDFLCDPVLAANVIFGIKLDAFQAARLRYYWWVQNCIDSSGVSSGKTIVIWLFVNLRCILIPDHEAAVYYPVFETGKMSFWDYYSKIKAPIFRAQLGQPMNLEPGDAKGGDGTLHGAACYKAFYRNGGKAMMPAPSFMKDAVTQASLRVNTMVVEEWTHVDASSDGINKQLIDRTTRPCWNQHHPIWGNHILYSAHAQTRLHPAFKRYNDHQRRVNRGDPTYANIGYSYKDYSDLVSHTGKSFREEHRIEGTINNKRNTCSKVEWNGQGFGIWGASGAGWFTEEALLQCVDNGRRRRVTPVLSRQQFEEGTRET